MTTRRLPRSAVAAAFALVGAAGPLLAASGPVFQSPEGSVRLVSAWASAPAGGDARLGVAFTLEPGWHVYWKNPGDAGYPPALELARDAPLTGAELRFPAPERYELAGGLVAIGYEDEVIYPIDARLANDVGPTAAIRGELDYLVCADTCLPYTAALELDLPVGEPTEDPEIAPRLEAWRARLPLSAASALDRVDAGLEPLSGPEMTLRLAFEGEGIEAVRPDLFFESHPLVAFDRPRFAAANGRPGFEVVVRPHDETKLLPASLDLAWTATGFERGGVPAAWSGTLSLARPAPVGGERWAALLALGLILAVVLALVLYRHRSSKPS